MVAVWLGLALLLGASPSARGYVIDTDGNGHPLWWPDSNGVGYRLVAGNTPGGAAGENAVHRAFASWSNASANVEYRFEGFDGEAAQRNDGKNRVYWVYQGWPYDSALAAVTFRFYDTRNGKLIDADIIVNGESYQWSDGGGGYDIENSLAHEVGHFGGLGHSDDSSATMFGRTRAHETAKRSLEGDDLAGLEAIYGGGSSAQSDSRLASAAPASDASASEGGGSGGGCSVARTASPRVLEEWLPIITLLALLQLRACRARRRPRGWLS